MPVPSFPVIFRAGTSTSALTPTVPASPGHFQAANQPIAEVDTITIRFNRPLNAYSHANTADAFTGRLNGHIITFTTVTVSESSPYNLVLSGIEIGAVDAGADVVSYDESLSITDENDDDLPAFTNLALLTPAVPNFSDINLGLNQVRVFFDQSVTATLSTPSAWTVRYNGFLYPVQSTGNGGSTFYLFLTGAVGSPSPGANSVSYNGSNSTFKNSSGQLVQAFTNYPMSVSRIPVPPAVYFPSTNLLQITFNGTLSTISGVAASGLFDGHYNNQRLVFTSATVSTSGSLMSISGVTLGAVHVAPNDLIYWGGIDSLHDGSSHVVDYWFPGINLVQGTAASCVPVSAVYDPDLDNGTVKILMSREIELHSISDPALSGDGLTGVYTLEEFDASSAEWYRLSSKILAIGNVPLTGTATGIARCSYNGSNAIHDDLGRLIPAWTDFPLSAVLATIPASIDAGDNIDLEAEITGAIQPSDFRWTTSGDGTFDDATSLTPTYTPGEDDIDNETVTISAGAYVNGDFIPMAIGEVTINSAITITAAVLTFTSTTDCTIALTLSGAPGDITGQQLIPGVATLHAGGCAWDLSNGVGIDIVGTTATLTIQGGGPGIGSMDSNYSTATDLFNYDGTDITNLPNVAAAVDLPVTFTGGPLATPTAALYDISSAQADITMTGSSVNGIISDATGGTWTGNTGTNDLDFTSEPASVTGSSSTNLILELLDLGGAHVATAFIAYAGDDANLVDAGSRPIPPFNISLTVQA